MSRASQRKPAAVATNTTTPTPPPIAVVVIEDNVLLREGIAQVITNDPGLKLVATAVDGAEAMATVIQAKPDVVLLDIGLADRDSLVLTAKVHEELPTAKVIVMGLLPVHEDVADFVEAGASGFILKDASVDDLLVTIHSVAEGAEVLPKVTPDSLLTKVVRLVAHDDTTVAADSVRLNSRERQIVELAGEGRSNAEIGILLGSASSTIASEVANAMEKLALHIRLDGAGRLNGIVQSAEVAG